MRTQLRKLQLWSSHACINVNASKCAITGILHGSLAQGLCSSPTDDKLLTRMLTQTFQVSRQFVPYLSPHQPYRHLGWHITLTLEWSKKFQVTRDRIQQQLESARVPPWHALQLIQRKFKPVVTYILCLAPFTLHEVEQLDAEFASIARTCCRLSLGTAHASIHLHHDHGGLGVHSLVEDYIQVTASSLVEVFNDSGPLGCRTWCNIIIIITRALWQQQQKSYTDMPADRLTLNWHNSTSARQFCLMRSANIIMRKGDCSAQLAAPQGSVLWSIAKQCLKTPILASSDKGPPINYRTDLLNIFKPCLIFLSRIPIALSTCKAQCLSLLLIFLSSTPQATEFPCATSSPCTTSHLHSTIPRGRSTYVKLVQYDKAHLVFHSPLQYATSRALFQF
jgi:hypothetical protein